MGWRTILWGALIVGPCLAADGPLDVPAPFHQAFEQIHQGQYQPALAASRDLEKNFPSHPLANLLAAEAYWGLIYCETGRINARQVWYLADRKTSRWDAEFFRAVDRTLEASRPLRSNPQTTAVGAFYSGLARGVRSRLYALRTQSLKSASEAKQMRADLLEAVAKNPQLAPDASLGLGAYNYYADALSPLLKLVRFFLRIPGGDRARGLEQLRIASQQVALLATEAQFELGRIYGIQESNHTESLQFFQSLAERYPENALYALSAAYQAEAAGNKNLAIELAQKASEAAGKMDGACRERLGEATRGAVERLQAAGGRESATR
ncbi:MAG: hypothetical protein A3H28_06035 [Acidobacteria bacterium RIFCSPLOWO2_02_FULL_61_28]|nr:MAG: hypothetical protein A3H28_06035 [Acidobacteria bacterium RIFCSPLOWO2_02_FULL_61_28]